MKNNIGIIGQGFVGTAIYEGLKNFYNLYAYDLDSSRSKNTLNEVIKNCGIIYVCVPTPMFPDGKCDLSIVIKVVEDLDNRLKIQRLNKNRRDILIIKSTVPPGTTNALNAWVSDNTTVIFSPEFLTEANSNEDFKNQNRIIFGGEQKATEIAKSMMRKAFPAASIILTKAEVAETVKYFTNTFLATKVTFANEFYDICQSMGVDYHKVVEYALYDERIGRSHLTVPGPDGDRGWGGHCFPKDLSALIYHSENNEHDPKLLKAVRSRNDEQRSDRDWEKQVGRAVSAPKGE